MTTSAIAEAEQDEDHKPMRFSLDRLSQMSQKQKRLFGGVVLVLGLAAFAAYMYGIFESEPPPGVVIHPTEWDDYRNQRPTPFKLRGRITVNQKVAMGRGWLIAYRRGMMDTAVGFAELRPDGSFQMDNVPPGELDIYVKKLIDKRPKNQLRHGHQEDDPDQRQPGWNERGNSLANFQPAPGMNPQGPPGANTPPGMSGPPETMDQINRKKINEKAPSRKELESIEMPEVKGELPPAVEWLYKRVYEKYGFTQDQAKIHKTINKEEGETLVFDLKIDLPKK